FAERFHLIDPLAQEKVYSSFGALVKFLPGAAYRVTDRLSIGGTCGVGVSYADLNGPYFLQGPSLPGPFTIMHTHNEGACLVWSVAAQYKLTDCDTFGVTYQSPSDLSMGGNTHVNVQAPALGASTYDSTLHVTWPQTVSLGIKHEFCPHRRMGVDVVWY